MNRKKFKFNQKIEITDPLRVFFLCGTKFTKDGLEDKRNVLKNHIETNYNSNHKVIILEEHFIFGNKKSKKFKDHLSYDQIFMKNLKDVEILTGLYSDKIFIIHESISTAAELGMFATDINLLKRTCLITPDTFSVEEDKISAFIRLAFFNYKSKEDNIKNITFYPKIKKNIVSEIKTDYHSYFPQNKIPKNLGINIDKFIKEDDKEIIKVSFKKSNFNKISGDQNTISYFYNNKELNVYISPEIIRILLISLFNLSDLRKELRTNSAIKDSVQTLQNNFKLIIMNSISHIEGFDFSQHQIKIFLNDRKLEIRTAIGYFLYMLQAMDMVKLPNNDKNFVISPKFERLFNCYSNIIKEIKPSKFNDSL
ncbi:hypothetical protein LIT25_05010 [Bacillus sp. F19]|nr:hypothetical protein LIT25_05010 [Bacillus sp. F19]